MPRTKKVVAPKLHLLISAISVLKSFHQNTSISASSFAREKHHLSSDIFIQSNLLFYDRQLFKMSMLMFRLARGPIKDLSVDQH